MKRILCIVITEKNKQRYSEEFRLVPQNSWRYTRGVVYTDVVINGSHHNYVSTIFLYYINNFFVDSCKEIFFSEIQFYILVDEFQVVTSAKDRKLQGGSTGRRLSEPADAPVQRPHCQILNASRLNISNLKLNDVTTADVTITTFIYLTPPRPARENMHQIYCHPPTWYFLGV